MQVTATANSVNVGTTTFTVTGAISGAIPVNFRQTLFRIDPHAVLHFEYNWDSSSGSKADLSACRVEEYVTYQGPNPFPWPSPPYEAGNVTYWPDTGNTPVAATVQDGIKDDHGHVLFQTPYVFKYVASDQKYQFQCTYYQANQWVQLMPISGTLAIGRVVNITNGSPPWTYQITKQGHTASAILP
jgi:hypothetical protein